MSGATDRPDVDNVEQYYDGFLRRLTIDYLVGNARVEAALAMLLRRLPPTVDSILDMGCGLGWTSYEMARAFPSAQVLGVDLSATLVNNAERIFRRPNLSYRKLDLTAPAALERRFDAVTLIDVYEHIPREERIAFHRRLSALLEPTGRVLITCPTVHYQAWLARNDEASLQPVDEDVSAVDLLRLAEEVEGELTLCSYESIWHSNDYLHAVVERAPAFERAVPERRRRTTSRLDRIVRVLRYWRGPGHPLRSLGVWRRVVRRTLPV